MKTVIAPNAPWPWRPKPEPKPKPKRAKRRVSGREVDEHFEAWRKKAGALDVSALSPR